MDRRLGIDVLERHDQVVLVLDLGRAFTRGDPAEEAGRLRHACIIARRCRDGGSEGESSGWGPARNARSGFAATATTGSWARPGTTKPAPPPPPASRNPPPPP